MSGLDLTGCIFGKLRVLGAGDRIGTRTAWLCECDCGAVRAVRTIHLRAGSVASCGSYACRKRHITHGQTPRGRQPAEYRIWAAMKARCLNPRSKGYARYGGRGVSVCKRWADSYVAFLNDLGPRPSAAHSVDRIDNDKGYEPGNCRWATKTEQAQNQTKTIFIDVGGKRVCLAEAARIAGVHYQTAYSRWKRGVDILEGRRAA